MTGPTPHDLTCQQFVELVTEYLEGSLPAADRARFDAHLLDCDDCPIYLDQIRLTIATAGRLSAASLDPAARDILLARFRHWQQHDLPPLPANRPPLAHSDTKRNDP